MFLIVFDFSGLGGCGGDDGWGWVWGWVGDCFCCGNGDGFGWNWGWESGCFCCCDDGWCWGWGGGFFFFIVGFCCWCCLGVFDFCGRFVLVVKICILLNLWCLDKIFG